MKAVLGGIVGAVLFAASAHASIVQDGSFETGAFAPNWNVVDLSGVTPDVGPTVVSIGQGTSSTPYGDIIPSYMGAMHAAYFVADFANQTISQTFTLSANTTYSLSFGLFQTQSGANNAGGFTLTDMLGATTMTFTDAATTPGSWVTESESFTTTTGGPFTLSYNFTSGPTPAKDLLLTGIQLSAVPLPASAPMFGAALLALGAVGYGMKRKANASA